MTDAKSVHQHTRRNSQWNSWLWFPFAFLFVTFAVLKTSHEDSKFLVCSKTRNIYTVDPEKPRVECICVKGPVISRVGSFEELKGNKPPIPLLPVWIAENMQQVLHRGPKVIHLDSTAVVLPGLADAHAHIIENGFKMQLQLDTADSIHEVVERIRAYIISHPDLPEDRWIEGMGWNQNRWGGPEAEFPTAADLDTDPLLKGRAIALRRVDGHATWVSPRVLEIMGNLPSEVEGGIIVRDDKGKATGVFIDNAINLIPSPEWTDDQLSEYFHTTMRQAVSYGLTSIHDADTLPQMREFIKKQADAAKIPIRLYLMLNGHMEVPKGGQLFKYGKDSRLTIRSIKMYTDGALGSWGAALLEPYSDKPETNGIMRNTQEEMDQLVRKYRKDGWQVNIHCIGDRANHVVLDIFEDMINGRNEDTQINVTEWRPRIEHAQIMTMEDLERAGKLGVITSVQPTHATSDMWYAETRLGPERIKGAYAYQSQLRHSQKNVLPLGSDFPVEGVNPLLGFYAAVSRLSTDGTSPHGEGGWYSSERLTREQALKGMTLDAAYASFTENELGSLEPGKKADFVVLDRDIMTIPFEDILKTKVKATFVDGKAAYGGL